MLLKYIDIGIVFQGGFWRDGFSMYSTEMNGIVGKPDIDPPVVIMELFSLALHFL
jgi:hypothetical protein